MGQKRKRDTNGASTSTPTSSVSPTDTFSKLSIDQSTSFQVIAGSYDRVLHGLRVTTHNNDPKKTTFTPLFLFTAHASAIRCLAVSPASSGESSASSSSKRILATSSTDTKINLYHLHTRTNLGTLAPPSASPITSLVFPSKSTLISTDEAGYIHIFRTRDWSLLSSLHAPNPKPKNGMAPQGGINSMAVHPSGKLALSVSRNERAVRMWNMMTGRKAGVLGFPVKEIPRAVTGVSGEGLKVVWRHDGKGYAVMFERGVVLFGEDSVMKGKIVASPISKVCQVKFLETSLGVGDAVEEICLVGTEDGRVLVYIIPAPSIDSTEVDQESEEIKPILVDTVRPAKSAEVVKSRIKDFDILSHPSSDSASQQKYFITTANSEGVIRVYLLNFAKVLMEDKGSLTPKKQKVADKDPATASSNGNTKEQEEEKQSIKKDGFAIMLGEYDTNRRITCLVAAEVEDTAASIVTYVPKNEIVEEDADSSNTDSESDEDDGDMEDEDKVDDQDEDEEEWGGIDEKSE